MSADLSDIEDVEFETRLVDFDNAVDISLTGVKDGGEIRFLIARLSVNDARKLSCAIKRSDWYHKGMMI